MHITIISQCEKKAWFHTRRILDSYARRIGDRTWATPITQEGLSELHGMMKSVATRQTAVACYLNEGNQRMKLVWTIGSKTAFSTDGFAPVAFTRKPKASMAPWWRDVCLLAQASGYLHDWGKTSQDFANKLQASVRGESALSPEVVRHEWLSYCLYKAARESGSGFEDAWSGALNEAKILDLQGLKKGVVDKHSAMEFVLVTHHCLFGGRLGQHQKPGAAFADLTLGPSNHVRHAIPPGGVRPVTCRGGEVFEIEKSIHSDAMRLVSRLSDQVGQDYWCMISIIARACLILADHQVSSIDYLFARGTPAGPTLFANTKEKVPGRPARRYDQPLNWHLRNVGEKASDISQHLSRSRFDGLSQGTIESILEPARNPRFRWQDIAKDFLVKAREDHTGPALIFNGAGTGAGKTRSNAKMICALSDNPRFCVALNLRSLTLQTGDSLKKDLRIMPSELAVVIGDRVVETLHRASADAFTITGSDDTEIEVFGPDYSVPDWLKPYSKTSKSNQLLMPPVLVSTIDFIINASEPGRQGHHALALLRVMNSDLVLDELDSYDPTAMVAVLRLIQLSAMLGRNVICSSATLSAPVASAVYQAFVSGIQMRVAADPESGNSMVVLVDDLLPPELVKLTAEKVKDPGAAKDFESLIGDRHARLCSHLAEKPAYRLATIGDAACSTESEFYASVAEHVQQLHDVHQWSIGLGRNLSFGLVRVANIRTAIHLARSLSAYFSNTGAKICCYHSNELRIQRHLKEKRLDFLLNRKSGFKHIANDAEINQAFSETIHSIPFIVIATPVEEVGRDHDFDWAVVEPSSAQSIVQTCGRVNRHRLAPVSEPNVVLLNKNRNAVLYPDKPCFVRPGLEGKLPALRYASQEVSVLCGKRIGDQLPVDASLRLGDFPIGVQESGIIKKRLQFGMDVILRKIPSGWMSQAFYQQFPLREFTRKEQFRYAVCKDSGGFGFQQMVNAKEKHWSRRPLKSLQRVANDWLTWPLDDLRAESEKLGIKCEDGLYLEIASYAEGEVDVVWDESFGFSLQGKQH